MRFCRRMHRRLRRRRSAIGGALADRLFGWAAKGAALITLGLLAAS